MYRRHPSAHKSAAERVNVCSGEQGASAAKNARAYKNGTEGEEEATWRADQHARVHVGHLRRAVDERGEALNVLFLLRDVALVLQDLQAMCQKHCTLPVPPQPLLQCPCTKP